MRLIYTGWIQRRRGALPFGKHTIPVMEAYAERVGAELVVLTETSRRNPQHVILDAICDLADRPDPCRGLWLDLDIVVRPDARDLFALQDRFWASVTHGNTWKRKEFRRYLAPRGHLFCYPYFSTCVMAFSSRHARTLAAGGARDTDHPPVGDQAIVNAIARNTELGFLFFPPAVIGPASIRKQCEFIHCGGKSKGRKVSAQVTQHYP